MIIFPIEEKIMDEGGSTIPLPNKRTYLAFDYLWSEGWGGSDDHKKVGFITKPELYLD